MQKRLVSSFICGDEIEIIYEWSCDIFSIVDGITKKDSLCCSFSKIGLKTDKNIIGDGGSPWNAPLWNLKLVDSHSEVTTRPSRLEYRF